jgi:hypothetical protein
LQGKPAPGEAALRQELAQAKAKISELHHEMIAQAQRFRDEWKQRTAKPKAERPAPTPDEARERRIKALTTEVRNLKAQIRYIMGHDGALFTPELERKIRVCLHPDWVTDPKQRRRYEEAAAEFNAVMDATKAKKRQR